MNRTTLIATTLIIVSLIVGTTRSNAPNKKSAPNWIGTWATAAQPSSPTVQSYSNQTLRLIVHTSIGGSRARIKISNTYGDKPMVIGAARIARRLSGADIDPASDRALLFSGQTSTAVAPGAMVTSDPVDLEVAPLADLAISIFLPEMTPATTVHNLAKQTNYISANGDHTSDVKFPVAKSVRNWPFLTGVEVAASPRGAAIVAFGSSLTDGDGTTTDTNRRWPDVLAERLQKNGNTELGAQRRNHRQPVVA